MSVETLIDLYGFTWGFYLFQLLFELCQSSGLIFLGFIKLYSSYAIKVSESAGEDWDAKSALPSVTVGTIKMFLVVIFCFVPLYPMEVSEIRIIERQCEATPQEIRREQVSQITDAGEGGNQVIEQVNVMFGGSKIRMPISMKILFGLAQWMKDETIRKIPCNTEMRLFADRINLEKIADPSLRQETLDFEKTCYRPAVRKASRLREYSEDMTWVAAPSFMNDAKYYMGADKDGFYSTKPNPRFSASDSLTDQGDNLPSELGGYPSCYVWWNGDESYGSELTDEGKGLGSQLYHAMSDGVKSGVRSESVNRQIDRLFRNKTADRPEEFFDEAFPTVEHKALYFAYFTPAKIDLREASTSVDYSWGERGEGGVAEVVGSFFGWANLASTSFENSAGATMIQKAMPLIKPFLITLILFAAPIVYVVSSYNGAAIATVHVTIGTILYWPAIWTFARNIDDNIRQALDLGVASTENMLLQALSWSLFLGAPMMMTGLLAWAGYNSATGLSDLAGKGIAQSAGSAGKKGAQNAKKGANDFGDKLVGGKKDK